MEGMRENARQEHWRKFDTIITTLIALNASPPDFEERLRSVLDSKMGKRGEADQSELQGAAAELDPDTASRGRPNSKDGNHDPKIKVEDDEEQQRNLIDYNTIHVSTDPVTSKDQRKREATVDLGTENHRSKRLARRKNGTHPASQQSNNVESGASQDSSSEPPCDANRDLTPAADIYRNEKRVFVRPKVGWQFREFKGTTKVWYAGKWQPLIQDQPSFKGVRESKGGWIVPIMAGSRGASVEQRKRWEQQGKVEFNSPF